jgi:hypothetical protein
VACAEVAVGYAMHTIKGEPRHLKIE